MLISHPSHNYFRYFLFMTHIRCGMRVGIKYTILIYSSANCQALSTDAQHFWVITSTNAMDLTPNFDANGHCSLPQDITSIAEDEFRNCTILTSIHIPNSVASIGKSAFRCCKFLTSVHIPNSVISIEEWAFSGCKSLTSIDIPNSVTSIGARAFIWCTALTSIVIPNSVTSIGAEAFKLCTFLTSVTIPNSVTSIGAEAFSRCESLTSINIPNSVTSIGAGAFKDCKELRSVVLPDQCTISYDIFENNHSLKYVLSSTSENLSGVPKYTIIAPRTRANIITALEYPYWKPSRHEPKYTNTIKTFLMCAQRRRNTNQTSLNNDTAMLILEMLKFTDLHHTY